jgi:hypothetical protein
MLKDSEMIFHQVHDLYTDVELKGLLKKIRTGIRLQRLYSICSLSYAWFPPGSYLKRHKKDTFTKEGQIKMSKYIHILYNKNFLSVNYSWTKWLISVRSLKQLGQREVLEANAVCRCHWQWTDHPWLGSPPCLWHFCLVLRETGLFGVIRWRRHVASPFFSRNILWAEKLSVAPEEGGLGK